MVPWNKVEELERSKSLAAIPCPCRAQRELPSSEVRTTLTQSNEGKKQLVMRLLEICWGKKTMPAGSNLLELRNRWNACSKVSRYRSCLQLLF